jgi:hypothetical protein
MKKRAVVGVGLAGFPEKAAGNSWAFLQWGLGLRDLGWEVWLVESLQKKEIFYLCAVFLAVYYAYYKIYS